MNVTAVDTGVVRLQEVAKAARVSVSTASRALKDDPRISKGRVSACNVTRPD